jgi:peptidoglycan/LPS O-acetylase OafA/YrhL
MKYGGFEGSPEEISNFFENQGLRPSDYLDLPEARLQRRWLVIPAVIIAAAVLLMVFLGSHSHRALVVFFVLGFGGGTWLTVNVQIRFKNPVATFVAAAGVVLALLVAAGFIAPEETADFIQKIRKGQ